MLDDAIVAAALRACVSREDERSNAYRFGVDCVLGALDPLEETDRTSLQREFRDWVMGKGGNFEIGPHSTWVGDAPPSSGVLYAWLPCESWKHLLGESDPDGDEAA